MARGPQAIILRRLNADELQRFLPPMTGEIPGQSTTSKELETPASNLERDLAKTQAQTLISGGRWRLIMGK